MKSANEIIQMLFEELKEHLDRIDNNTGLTYYNEILGDTSFLLAGLLHVLIKTENGIENSVWIDDSLITDIKQINNEVSISGVIIWGKENTTEQWVDPFMFVINLNNDFSDYTNYTFFFKDIIVKEISYEKFREDRNYFSDSIQKWEYKFIG